MKSLSRINFNNIKTVGIRVDFNIPVDEHFKIFIDRNVKIHPYSYSFDIVKINFQ